MADPHCIYKRIFLSVKLSHHDTTRLTHNNKHYTYLKKKRKKKWAGESVVKHPPISAPQIHYLDFCEFYMT